MHSTPEGRLPQSQRPLEPTSSAPAEPGGGRRLSRRSCVCCGRVTRSFPQPREACFHHPRSLRGPHTRSSSSAPAGRGAEALCANVTFGQAPPPPGSCAGLPGRSLRSELESGPLISHSDSQAAEPAASARSLRHRCAPHTLFVPRRLSDPALHSRNGFSPSQPSRLLPALTALSAASPPREDRLEKKKGFQMPSGCRPDFPGLKTPPMCPGAHCVSGVSPETHPTRERERQTGSMD
ncbi:uncharacterized protein LOC132540923 [Erinaceus europaeus]|uniref:Uncharacterized protein LOC132540923 n=1 Tax=Erinaceus europaeus TaxID=9365 RepID=A0ABM3Y5M1_ERIEU|nr:uncharacterized protein LOC132540923 [Erinaceus europaeus]